MGPECGHHATYTFYKAVKYRDKVNIKTCDYDVNDDDEVGDHDDDDGDHDDVDGDLRSTMLSNTGTGWGIPIIFDSIDTPPLKHDVNDIMIWQGMISDGDTKQDFSFRQRIVGEFSHLASSSLSRSGRPIMISFLG